MSAINGTAMPAILRLGDCTPKRRPVEVTRDGKPVTLQAYVYGSRCPTVAKCEIAAAHDEWMESTLIDPDKPIDEWARRDRSKLTAAYQCYLRDCILALVPGMAFEEADVLASDVDDETSPAKQLLVYLEYFTAPVQSDDAASDSTTGEETGDTDENPPHPSQLTLDLSLPTSSPVTESGSKTGSRSRSA
jgi:hypothetical protein